MNNISQVKSIQESGEQLFSRNRKETIYSNHQIQNNFQIIGSALTNHIKALRRNNLINLLSQKQPEQRNDKENKSIMQMLKFQTFFQPISNNYKYLTEISSKIGYSFFKKDDFIYKIHEFTEGYFILIKGQVELTIPQRIELPVSQSGLSQFDSLLFQQIKQKQKTISSNKKLASDKYDQPLKLSKRQSRLSIKLSRSPSIINSQHENSNQKQQNNSKNMQKPTRFVSQFDEDIQETDQLQNVQKEEQIICQNKVVKIVQEGECFGQITIGQVNKRATNAIAKQDCHLIIIKKHQYQLISKASLITQMKSLHNFLCKIPLLKKIYRYSLEGFLYYMQQVKCNYKSILYKQDSPIQYIYIIKQGQFTQFKSIKQNRTNKTVLGVHQSRNKVIEQDQQLNQFKSNKKYWREGFFKNVYQGQMIGDCQIYMKKQKYQESCKCISQTGVVYRMQKKLFFQKLFSPQNQVGQIKKYLHEKFKTKVCFMQNFMKQQKNQLIQRYLPPSRSHHSSLRKKSQIYSKRSPNQNIRVNSCGSKYQQNNFFDKFNRSVYKNLNKNRLSVHKHRQRSFSQFQLDQSRKHNDSDKVSNKIQKTNYLQKSIFKHQSVEKNVNIPSNIKDIVQMVNVKQKYQNVRKQTTKDTSKIFQFDMQKIPRFIQQKYNHLLAKIKR